MSDEMVGIASQNTKKKKIVNDINKGYKKSKISICYYT